MVVGKTVLNSKMLPLESHSESLTSQSAVLLSHNTVNIANAAIKYFIIIPLLYFKQL
jgi:hypothetical protein